MLTPLEAKSWQGRITQLRNRSFAQLNEIRLPPFRACSLTWSRSNHLTNAPLSSLPPSSPPPCRLPRPRRAPLCPRPCFPDAPYEIGAPYLVRTRRGGSETTSLRNISRCLCPASEPVRYADCRLCNRLSRQPRRATKTPNYIKPDCPRRSTRSGMPPTDRRQYSHADSVIL